MTLSAREAALNALAAYRTRGARPDMIISSVARDNSMDHRDIALCSRIVNGVLQNEALCDYYISHYAGRPVNRIDPVVIDILRITAYQILFLDRIPVHAAVSEGVSICRKRLPRATGFCNAVLRKLADGKNDLPPVEAGDRSEYLSIRYSHPKWLVDALTQQYGEESCEGILRTNNEPAPTTVFVNTLLSDAHSVREMLVADGADVRCHTFLDNAFYIFGGALDELEAFQKGFIYAQDAAAWISVNAADVSPGYEVLDVCSAPGGKSFAAAIMMGNKGRITSCDIHSRKLGMVKSGADRMGISIIRTETHDGRIPFSDLESTCDLVITDVPCSGLGVIRKKPEIRYKDPEELARLPKIQLSILENASSCVRKGGTLIYSTCTILKRENEDVVNAFLKNHSNFSLSPFTMPGPFGSCDGIATILPHICDTDGFFICRMQRN